MSRRDNSVRIQLDFFEDHFEHASLATKKAIQNSWAGFFGESIFPLIDESLFDPIYSNRGRPSCAVNILYSALLIETIFKPAQDAFFLDMICDISMQYALHTTKMEVPPFSKQTFSRFKLKLLSYQKKEEKDLFQICNAAIANKLKGKRKIPKIFRHLENISLNDVRF